MPLSAARAPQAFSIDSSPFVTLLTSGELDPAGALKLEQRKQELLASKQERKSAILPGKPRNTSAAFPVSTSRMNEREAIEADVVKLVVERCDTAIRTELLAQIDRQKRVADDDSDGFVKLDELFHRTLAEMAGKSYAWRVIEEVKAQMDRVRYLSVEKLHVRLLISQHEEIVAGIVENDAPRAEAAMRAHLREILKSLPEVAKARPDLFGAAR